VSTLQEILCSPDNRAKVIREAVQLVDDEVSAKGGLSGLAIKAGYAAVKTIKPGLITEAVDVLLDRFVQKLEPFHSDWQGSGKTTPFDAFLVGRTDQAVSALLSVTDERARNIQNSTIRKTYEKLRPQAEKNVQAAIPGLGRLLSHFVR
jgi:hypothetical protein